MKLLLIAFGLLLPLVAAELALRLFGPVLPGNYTLGIPLTYHPVFGSFHPPNSRGWFRNAEFATRFQYNGKGLSGPELPYDKPPGVARVLVLGDSFVEGNEVAFADRATERLQARFDRERGPGRVEIVNAGVAGWSNSQELLYYEQEGYRFAPDLVVLLVYLHNDIPDNTPTRDSESGTRTKPYFALVDGRLVELPWEAHTASAAEQADHLARQWCLLWDLLQNGVLRKPGQTVRLGFERTLPRMYLADEPTDLRRAWAVTEALLARLRDGVAARGGRLAIVGVPSKWQVYPREWRKVLDFFRARNVETDLELPNRRLDAIGARQGVPTLDLLPAFIQAAGEQGGLYYEIDAHWTAAGQRVAAEALYDFLASNQLVP